MINRLEIVGIVATMSIQLFIHDPRSTTSNKETFLKDLFLEGRKICFLKNCFLGATSIVMSIRDSNLQINNSVTSFQRVKIHMR